MDKFIEYIMLMSKDDKKLILDALLAEQNGIKTIEKKNGYKEAFEIARIKALDELKNDIEYNKIELLIRNPEKGAWREAAYFIELNRSISSTIKTISFEEYCNALKDPDFNNPDITIFQVASLQLNYCDVPISFDKKYKNDIVYAAERIYAEIIWDKK